MRDKVVLGITLTVILLVTLVIYGAVDTARVPATASNLLEKSVDNGRHLYAQYCIQCHGPLGEGCIGPALNRTTWKATINGVPNPDFDDGSTKLIQNTITRGRNSNQPGVQMPAWANSENGPLNDEEIGDLVNFIQNGDWAEVLEAAASATGLDEPLPTYPGFDDEAEVARVKQVMLEKGCLTCHTLGKGGGKVGADLTQVGSRRTAEWLRKWVHDPKTVPADQRGPNLWLIAPTPSLETPGPNSEPTATPQIFPMNATYMPTIQMTDEELDLLVDYLSHAKIAK